MSDLKTVLITDSRIEDISGDISFAVQNGAQQNTFQPQMANTSSNTSHSWQINVPSENIVVDRRLLIDTDVVFTIGITNVPSGEPAMDWGVDIGFGPYPINSCYLTQNALINNCGLTVNTQDIMAALLRMNEQVIHTHYDGWTPSMVDDTYYYYADAGQSTNNPLSGIRTASHNNKFRGRGCHPIEILSVVHTLVDGTQNESLGSRSENDTFLITIKTHLTEPILFLSPFISNPTVANEAGFLGINNMTFNFTIDNTLKRVFRTAKPYTYTFGFGNVTGNNSGWSNLRILMNYLSVQPSQYAKISARNILPLLQYDRYITNNGNNQELPAGGSVKYSSSNIALNQIPDSLIIFGRVPMAQQSSGNSDSFFAIKSISVNFNNVSGLLASCTPQELWQLSQKAGSSQSFIEFTGKAYASAESGRGESVATIGSILVLQPSYCFNLPDYLSSSSLGSYNLQFDLTLENQSSENITPEIVVIAVTSGYMSIHQGSAQSFSGVLNKEMVMTAKDGPSVPRLSQSDYERLVGGTMNNRGVTNLTKMLRVKKGPQISTSDTGGIISGGVMSGGKLGKYLR